MRSLIESFAFSNKFHLSLTSSVKAYDSTCPEKGAVFEVPVTVVKPEPMTQNEITFSKQHFASGDIQRRFIAVPKDATWAGTKAVSYLIDSKFIFLYFQWSLLSWRTKNLKPTMHGS